MKACARPGAVTTLSTTNTSAMEQLSQRAAGCTSCAVREVQHRHRHETVDATIEFTPGDWYTGHHQRVRVGDALVAKRIMAGDDNDGGRQPAQVSMQRCGIRIHTIADVRDVLIPIPLQ